MSDAPPSAYLEAHAGGGKNNMAPVYDPPSRNHAPSTAYGAHLSSLPSLLEALHLIQGAHG